MGFSAEWLALRDPADLAARDAGLLAAAAEHAGTDPVVVDLGCGTGATRRAFGGLLPAQTRWRMVDSDADLLMLAVARTSTGLDTGAGPTDPGYAPPETPQATAHCLDLRDLDQVPLAGASLVTASALLDLVSADWLGRLAAGLARLGLPFHAALSYDGVMHWTPPHPDDARITNAFNRHQRGDKGFGPALGPDAAQTAARIFAAAGYRVHLAQSPWRLGPDQADLQRDLVIGIAGAAQEAGVDATDWLAARLAAIAAGAGSSFIGHQDLLALPVAGTVLSAAPGGR